MASIESIKDALQSLEFDGLDESFGTYETNPDKILENIMNGGNEIGISLYAFLGHFKDVHDGWGATTLQLAELFSDELWKRELLLGVVTPFHPATVTAAIRQRPDLLTEMGNWFAVFDTSYVDVTTEEAPQNIEREAERLIENTLKFVKFMNSKVPTMTVVVGQEVYQISKNQHHDYYASGIRNECVIGNRIVSWEAHGISPDKNVERTIFATLLLQRNQVLAIGAEATINQIFDRENLGKLVVNELINEPAPNEQSAGEIIAEEPDVDSFSFDISPETAPVSTKTIPMTEDLFDLISDAVSHVCADRRTIMTACVMITDDHVKLSAKSQRFYEPYKLDTELFESPTLADFSMEIKLLEQQARETLEDKIFDVCRDYLDLSDSDLNHPLSRSMTDLLVEGVRRSLRLQDDFDYSYIWHELKVVKRRPEFFLGVAVDQYNTKKELALKLSGKMR
jgi:hypothetical protein